MGGHENGKTMFTGTFVTQKVILLTKNFTDMLSNIANFIHVFEIAMLCQVSWKLTVLKSLNAVSVVTLDALIVRKKIDRHAIFHV